MCVRVIFVILNTTFFCNYAVPGGIGNPYLVSTILTGVAFFGVGAAKSWFVDEPWYRAGVETLLVGGGAALLAYLVGMFLGRFIQ